MDAAHAADIAQLRAGIGVESVFQDVITARLARAFEATFDGDPSAVREGAVAPMGIHWCLHTPADARTCELNYDGTDALAGGLPTPQSLPRRMRAGGALHYHRPLRVGAEVTRRDRIVAVEPRQGRSGPLCFVVVERRYFGDGELSLVERIDSVFRAPSQGSDPSVVSNTPPTAVQRESRPVAIHAALLMRYSALTFNAHRIHFDDRYCREVEGYPGCVVHGPLQATLLLREALAGAGAVAVESFEYRARKPLILGEDARIDANREGARLDLAMLGGDGVPSMTAMARFAS